MTSGKGEKQLHEKKETTRRKRNTMAHPQKKRKGEMAGTRKSRR